MEYQLNLVDWERKPELSSAIQDIVKHDIRYAPHNTYTGQDQSIYKGERQDEKSIQKEIQENIKPRAGKVSLGQLFQKTSPQRT